MVKAGIVLYWLFCALKKIIQEKFGEVVRSGKLYTMKQEYESIKLPKELIGRMRAHKDKTGVPIITFASMAISNALANLNKKSKPKK